MLSEETTIGRVQYSRKRRRPQRGTVSGEMMTSACRRPVQTRARPTQGGPEHTIHRVEPRPGRRSPVDGELPVQGQVLEGELAVAADDEGEESE